MNFNPELAREEEEEAPSPVQANFSAAIDSIFAREEEEEAPSPVQANFSAAIDSIFAREEEEEAPSPAPVVPDTTVGPVPVVPDTTVGPAPVVPDTTVGPAPVVPDTTVGPVPVVPDTTFDFEFAKSRIKHLEKFSATPYPDSKKIPTIGWGHNLRVAPIGKKKITRAEADTHLVVDMGKTLKQLDARLKDWRKHPTQVQTVLFDAAFNMGVDSLSRFDQMWKALAKKDYGEAAKHLLDSDYAREDVPNRAKLNAFLMRGVVPDKKLFKWNHHVSKIDADFLANLGTTPEAAAAGGAGGAAAAGGAGWLETMAQTGATGLERSLYGLGETTGAGVELAGDLTGIEGLQRLGQRIRGWNARTARELDMEVEQLPEFLKIPFPWAEDGSISDKEILYAMASSAAPMAAMGVTGAAGTGLLASRMAASPIGRAAARLTANIIPKLKGVPLGAETAAAGLISMTATNSLYEGVSQYGEAKGQGLDDSEAQRQAGLVAAMNLATLPTHLAGAIPGVNIAKRAVLGGLSESVEEVYQGIASELAAGEEIKVDEEMALGFITGLILGGATDVGLGMAADRIRANAEQRAKKILDQAEGDLGRAVDLVKDQRPNPETDTGDLGDAPNILPPEDLPPPPSEPGIEPDKPAQGRIRLGGRIDEPDRRVNSVIVDGDPVGYLVQGLDEGYWNPDEAVSERFPGLEVPETGFTPESFLQAANQVLAQPPPAAPDPVPESEFAPESDFKAGDRVTFGRMTGSAVSSSIEDDVEILILRLDDADAEQARNRGRKVTDDGDMRVRAQDVIPAGDAKPEPVAELDPEPGDIEWGPSPDDAGEVAEANFRMSRIEDPEDVPLQQITGQDLSRDPQERQRVQDLADQIRESRRFDRVLVDDEGYVLEGQHRRAAAELLGMENVPIQRIRNLERNLPADEMIEAAQQAGGLRPEQARQLVGHIAEMVNDEGSLEKAQEVLDPGENFDAYDAAFVVAGLKSQRPLQLDEIRPQVEKKPKDPVLWRQYLKTAFDDEDLADQVAYRLANQEEVDFESADQLVRLQHEAAGTDSPVNPDLPDTREGFRKIRDLIRDIDGFDEVRDKIQENERRLPWMEVVGEPLPKEAKRVLDRFSNLFGKVFQDYPISIFTNKDEMAQRAEGRLQGILTSGSDMGQPTTLDRTGIDTIFKSTTLGLFTPEDFSRTVGEPGGYLYLDPSEADPNNIQMPYVLAHELAHALAEADKSRLIKPGTYSDPTELGERIWNAFRDEVGNDVTPENLTWRNRDFMEWWAQNLGHYIVTRETRTDRVGAYFRRLGDMLIQWYSDVMELLPRKLGGVPLPGAPKGARLNQVLKDYADQLINRARETPIEFVDPPPGPDPTRQDRGRTFVDESGLMGIREEEPKWKTRVLGEAPNPTALKGRQFRIKFPGKKETIESQYMVVEESELWASNHPISFSQRPPEEYPAEIQNRTYDGDAGQHARDEVVTNAANLESDQVIDTTSSVSYGPPVVTPTGGGCRGQCSNHVDSERLPQLQNPGTGVQGLPGRTGGRIRVRSGGCRPVHQSGPGAHYHRRGDRHPGSKDVAEPQPGFRQAGEQGHG